MVLILLTLKSLTKVPLAAPVEKTSPYCICDMKEGNWYLIWAEQKLQSEVAMIYEVCNLSRKHTQRALFFVEPKKKAGCTQWDIKESVSQF